jgi:ComF family protein
LCQHCVDNLKFASNRCFECGKKLRQDGRDNIRCSGCVDFSSPLYQTVVAGDYYNPVRRLINGLRFGDRRVLAKALAFILAHKIRAVSADLPQVIIPVPVHANKLKQLGYNPALEIANYLSLQLNIPVASDLCMRIKDTKSQNKLSLHERKLNMARAFSVVMALANEYQHVVILDDLVSSGITVKTLAAELLKSAIERIDVWCIAHI